MTTTHCLSGWIVGVTLAAAVAGCDDRQASTAEAPPPDPAPASQPAATTPAVSAPAEVRAPKPLPPADTFMAIAENGMPQRMISFPPARLRLRQTPEGLHAVLYTDDPPIAASKDYRGNSYLFDMKLDVNDVVELEVAQWRYQANGSAADTSEVKSTNGIFLDGWKSHLQPVDVIVAFEGKPPHLLAKVAGQFRVIVDDADAQPHTALVQGMLPVTVEMEKEKSSK